MEPRCMNHNFAADLDCDLWPDHDGSHIAVDKRNMVVAWPNEPRMRWVSDRRYEIGNEPSRTA